MTEDVSRCPHPFAVLAHPHYSSHSHFSPLLLPLIMPRGKRTLLTSTPLPSLPPPSSSSSSSPWSVSNPWVPPSITSTSPPTRPRIEIPQVDYVTVQRVLEVYFPHRCWTLNPQLNTLLMGAETGDTHTRLLQKALSRLSRDCCVACPPRLSPPAPPLIWNDNRV